MLFGPSALGHNKILRDTLFPKKGSVVLETVSLFGLMFTYFVWSVKLDLSTLWKTEKLAIALGISVFSCTLVIPTGLSFLIKKYVAMQSSLANALPFIAMSPSLVVFISIAALLKDLKIQNSDVGRISLAVSMLTNTAGFVVVLIMFLAAQYTHGDILKLIYSFLSVSALFILIVFVMRPMILWTVKHSRTRDSLSEMGIVNIFVFVVFSGFLSELIGQHYGMGPIILGISLPEGPPIGTSMMRILETICTALLNPICLAVNGLQVDIFKIDFRSLWLISLVLVVAFLVKIGAVMLPGYYYNLPMKQCWAIGLILNGKGICELVLYNLWMSSGVCVCLLSEFNATS